MMILLSTIFFPAQGSFGRGRDVNCLAVKFFPIDIR